MKSVMAPTARAKRSPAASLAKSPVSRDATPVSAVEPTLPALAEPSLATIASALAMQASPVQPVPAMTAHPIESKPERKAEPVWDRPEPIPEPEGPEPAPVPPADSDEASSPLVEMGALVFDMYRETLDTRLRMWTALAATPDFGSAWTVGAEMAMRSVQKAGERWSRMLMLANRIAAESYGACRPPPSRR